MSNPVAETANNAAPNGVDIFMCAQVESAWGYAAIAATVLGAVIYLIFLNVWGIREKRFGKNNDEDASSAQYNNQGPISDDEYLTESIQLSEKMLMELSASIVSFEKKSLAIIPAAVAIAGFLISKQWCFDILDVIRGISITFAVITIFAAGFVITDTHIGATGVAPDVLVGYWYEMHNTKINSSSTQKNKNVYKKNLLLTTLARYTVGAAESNKTFAKKEAKFTAAVYGVTVSFSSLLVWLFAKFTATI